MNDSEVILPRPDDWHVHVRDGELLRAVVPATAAHFARAIIMPNLKPAVTTAAAARAYRERIVAAVPAGLAFEPLMTCYLTDHTTPEELVAGARDGSFIAAKLYPAGATTHADAGVTDIARLDAAFCAMAEVGLPLLVHGEVVDDAIDIFDREAVFIERVLVALRARHPRLKIVLEHATTAAAIEFVRAHDARTTAATVTPHHLVLNRNAMFAGGLRPHAYCLPVAKRERHRKALVEAVTSGDPHFFLGTDSAPHVRSAKEAACGCAGIYNAPVALATYAEVFAACHALAHFEAFAARNGPRFYGLPVNPARIALRRAEAVAPPAPLATAAGDIVVFEPPLACRWQVHALS